MRAGTMGLWVAAAVLATLRQLEIPGVEPVGYWPRWAMIWAMVAFDLGLVIEMASLLKTRLSKALTLPAVAAAWLVLVIGAIDLTWYHRPLARFREIEPGRIYMSAMPTERGLEVEQGRIPFRTIINLFPEETAQGSPLVPAEMKFAREHGIRYLGSPSDPSDAASSAFLDETLALAQDRACLADSGALPRLHGPVSGVDGHLQVCGEGTAAAGGDAGDRAAPGLPAEGVGHPAVQPGITTASGCRVTGLTRLRRCCGGVPLGRRPSGVVASERGSPCRMNPLGGEGVRRARVRARERGRRRSQPSLTAFPGWIEYAPTRIESL